MKEIQLTQGYITLVDDEDYKYLSKFKWFAKENDSSGLFYAERTIWDGIKNKHMKMHREILNITDNKILIDHKDGNSLNNQKYNLRICTKQQNMANSKKRINASSIYKGVSWDKQTNKWLAQICKEGKRQYLGRFILEKDAARAYNKAAIEYFGQYAKLNEVTI